MDIAVAPGISRVNVCFSKMRQATPEEKKQWLNKISVFNRRMKGDIKRFNRLIDRRKKKLKASNYDNLLKSKHCLHTKVNDQLDEISLLNMIINFDQLTQSLTHADFLGAFPSPRLVHRRVNFLRSEIKTIIFMINMAKKGENNER